jgi:type II secretory pathway component GspD/PulD (secretin)
MMETLMKRVLVAALLAVGASQALAADPPAAPAPVVSSFVFRDTPVAELFEMISRRERINIVLGKGVSGNVAVNLYDMTPRQAIYAIAEAGGYQVLARDTGYVIVAPGQGAPEPASAVRLEVRAMKVQYSDPALVAEILGRHVGRGGKVSVLPQRSMVVVEDTAEGIERIGAMLRQVDTRPKQVMIEAKILEITLDDNENFGIDWTKVFSGDGVNNFGTTGLTLQSGPRFFLNFVNNNVDAYLTALSNKGRVRTLATPKLLALENQEASTNIGDKLGYRLTTTINNVTSESIQFLDTGVILRVTPSVDADGKIVMRVRPEVSSGSVLGGIPSKKTTEVNTQLVAEDGQAVLIAGLIKASSGKRRVGLPLLGDVPLVGNLFASTEGTGSSTETVVLITPRIVAPGTTAADAQEVERVERTEKELQVKLAVPRSLR